MKSPQTAARGEKRPLILRAATEVFAEQGFAAVRVADIADRAGIGKGTVYEYFSSKDELLFAVFEWMNHGIAERIRALLDEGGTTVAETQTDGEGRYQFAGLLPGSYTVVETTPAGLIDGGAGNDSLLITATGDRVLELGDHQPGELKRHCVCGDDQFHRNLGAHITDNATSRLLMCTSRSQGIE